MKEVQATDRLITAVGTVLCRLLVSLGRLCLLLEFIELACRCQMWQAMMWRYLVSLLLHERSLSCSLLSGSHTHILPRSASNHGFCFDPEAGLPGCQCGTEAALPSAWQGTAPERSEAIHRRLRVTWSYVNTSLHMQARIVAARAELELKPLPFAQVSIHRCCACACSSIWVVLHV